MVLSYRFYAIMERDEFAGRRCVAMAILVQKDEGLCLSFAVPLHLTVLLWDQHSDRRAKTEAELLWYYVATMPPYLN